MLGKPKADICPHQDTFETGWLFAWRECGSRECPALAQAFETEDAS
jgi:hypothetical protein